MTARPITVRLADWDDEGDRDRLMQVRREVFVVEQNVPEEMEMDGLDPDETHFLAEDPDSGEPIGTARLANGGKVGRVAVLEEWRGCGIGRAIMNALIEEADSRSFPPLYLHGQTWTVPFYEKLGFEVDDSVDEFMEAGIPHRRMVRSCRGKA